MTIIHKIIFSISLLLFWACTSQNNVNTAANVSSIKKYHEIWSNGNVEDMDEIIDPEFRSHFIGGYEYAGMEGAKQAVLDTKKAFPDWNEDIIDLIAEENKIVTRYRSTGTHLGNWDGIDSTGNTIDIEEISIYYLKNGKIMEQWGFWDEINLKKQMLENTANNQ
jgi:predicted ester cyclase